MTHIGLYSHNKRKRQVGVFTANVRKAGMCWMVRRTGACEWAYAKKVRYNPRLLPVPVRRKGR